MLAGGERKRGRERQRERERERERKGRVEGGIYPLRERTVLPRFTLHPCMRVSEWNSLYWLVGREREREREGEKVPFA
jgi:hypothetical protein